MKKTKHNTIKGISGSWPQKEEKKLEPKGQNGLLGGTQKRRSRTLTRLCAKVDVGWGNRLFIRGEGGCLSWDHGQVMQNTGENEWSWETDTSTPLTFKFLINDQQWSNGENYMAPPGTHHTLRPEF
ncbi:MAG: hypothetical protein LBR62_02040 [Puniceicoccales bacterium]|jgi:hypothetical protein|nr:hypothetical protein [Puniceicoccales bacterium]